MDGKPIVTILTGIPFAGKTTLAGEINKITGRPIISIDTIAAQQGVWICRRKYTRISIFRASSRNK